MKHFKKSILLIVTLLVSHAPIWCVSSSKTDSLVDYFANVYHVDQKEFLKKIVQTKNINDFWKNNENFINNAPKNLLEAAYWLAIKLEKTDLAQKLLFIIENK